MEIHHCWQPQPSFPAWWELSSGMACRRCGRGNISSYPQIRRRRVLLAALTAAQCRHDRALRRLDDTGAQLLFRFVAAAYERRSLGLGSHWPFESWGRFLPEHTTAVSMLDRLLHHCHVVITDGDSYRMKQARARGGTKINNH
jgi:hypothetical protein